MIRNITAMAVFLKGRKVLLEKRRPDEDNYAGFLAFPGGHHEKGETIRQTLRREMKEELDVDVKEFSCIGEFDDIDPTSKNHYRHNAFLCTGWDGEITETREQERIMWVDISQLHLMEGISRPTREAAEKLKGEIDGIV